MLPFGNGRSYGDVCLNPGGSLLHTRGLDRFISFDRHEGVLQCEAGVLMSSIIELIQPEGWFLPVTPGTKFVTLGGAIANDVHGKNHHRAGSFGCHVRTLELLRSDGQRLLCSQKVHPDWFSATIGGLGLTGLITWAEIKLSRLDTPWLDVDTIRFDDLDHFAALSLEADRASEHTVAWLDCLRAKNGAARGLFMRANPSKAENRRDVLARSTVQLSVSPPFSLVHRWPLRIFNTAYARPWRGHTWRTVRHYDDFLYPLDSILNWNRIYGPRGFYQFQCVVPKSADVITSLLRRISESGEGSFLAILKSFGEVKSLGLLSFPRPGYTLAVDFPNRGGQTLALLGDLAAIVVEAGGAIYPAKDSCMSARQFQRFFPAFERFVEYVDPAFSSSFWRRVRG